MLWASATIETGCRWRPFRPRRSWPPRASSRSCMSPPVTEIASPWFPRPWERQALGVRNILCTSGSHQTLGRFRAAKNVYDIDSIQLLQTYANLAGECKLLGEDGITGAGPFCLGAVASPDADPLELQVSRLLKKTAAGAAFLDHPARLRPGAVRRMVERGDTARHPPEGRHRGRHSAAGRRSWPRQAKASGTPRAFRSRVIDRVASKGGAAAQRAAAIELAVETVRRLSGRKGLRGFGVCGDGDSDAALEIIEKSGLGSR